MSKKTWIIFAAVIVVLFGGLILASNKNKVNVSNVNTNAIQKATKASGNIADHTSGNLTTGVTLIEYGDYQCPYCGEVFPSIKSVTSSYQNQLGFVFRNFPLTTLHPDALAGAAAAEAAGLQGQYWQMHDLLYENQSSWDAISAGPKLTAQFTSYAEQLGLNTKKYQADLASSQVSQKITFDQALGNKLGVDSTPSFYLNGKVIPQSVISALEQSNVKPLEALINADLKVKGITPPTS